MTENEFLSHVSLQLSDALWSEPELAKKQAILEALSQEISQRILDTLPPGTVLMA